NIELLPILALIAGKYIRNLAADIQFARAIKDF
ncbi:MAG: hypothetical protein ACI9NT_001670, partial [Bacteroidia bacterium]